ncbi:MAG: DUF1269 domain-containing protein [Coriobacteriales bacterium]|nr:DUF1269 domain-containing protein [Coriobacteriales bacterium]
MNNVVTVLFNVESEAYQAFSELRENMVGAGYLASEAVLLKAVDKSVEVVDTIDYGVNTEDDTVAGALVGSLAGIIGGPVGMLLGGSIGALSGAVVDAADAHADQSLIEMVAGKLYNDEVAIIALVSEDVSGRMDVRFDKYNCVIIREDAALVAEEVERARETEAELKRQAKAQMRAEKKAERKAKIEEHKAALDARFAELKAKNQSRLEDFDEGVTDFETEANHAKSKVFGTQD